MGSRKKNRGETLPSPYGLRRLPAHRFAQTHFRLLALALDREAIGFAVVHDVSDGVARFDAPRPKTVEGHAVVREVDVAKVLGRAKRLQTGIHFCVKRREGLRAVRFLRYFP